MVRAFFHFTWISTFAFLMVVIGCSAQQQAAWKASHPTTQIIDRAAAIAPAAATSAITGNPLPVANSVLQFLGWLIAAGTTVDSAVQRVKKSRLTSTVATLTAPWDGKTHKRAMDGVKVKAVGSALAKNVIATQPGVQVEPFEEFRKRQTDGAAASIALDPTSVNAALSPAAPA